MIWRNEKFPAGGRVTGSLKAIPKGNALLGQIGGVTSVARIDVIKHPVSGALPFSKENQDSGGGLKVF
jgi:hypothetical protein